MFIEAIKLIDLPVGALDTDSKIGDIKDIVVDPENGHILGFLIKPGSSGWRIFSPLEVLSVIDITDWDPNGLVTGSIENLVPISEIVRIEQVVNKDYQLIGKKAKLESGKTLGRVENFLINTDLQMVAKFYIKDLFGNSRVLPYDKVVKIGKAVIFSDDISGSSGAIGAAA